MSVETWARARRDVVPALVSMVREAAAGSGPARIVVSGPPGAGASYVLAALGDAAPIPVRRTRADTGSAADPFAVARALLDAGQLDAEQTSSTAASARAELDACVDDLTASGPVLLVVEDLDRADAESLALLARVTEAAATREVVVVGNCRAGCDRAAVQRFLAADLSTVVQLPPFDAVDLDLLVRGRTGCWPGDGLRAMLGQVADSAFLLCTVLDGLTSCGAVQDDDTRLELRVDESMARPPSLDEVVAEVLAGLSGVELDAARALAVWGAPGRPADLAAVLGVATESLAPVLQRLLHAGVLTADDAGLGFAQDAYRAAVYTAMPRPVRAGLHQAASARAAGAQRARHTVAGAAAIEQVLAAVEAAADLVDAPAVAAELLDEAAANSSGGAAAAGLAATRARALARSGQLSRAAEVATEALPWTRDPATRSELHRVSVFSLTTRGKVGDAMSVIDEALGDPLPDRARRLLGEHRHLLGLLAGTSPVPLTAFGPGPEDLTLSGLVAESLRRFLLGQTTVALEYAWSASRRAVTGATDPNEGASAEVWPPLIELAHHGPTVARAALQEAIALRETRGAGWQTAGHQSIGAAIDATAGRLDDAAAQYDSALDTATRTGFGWTSQAVAARALLDVQRGRLSDAATRIEQWSTAPGPLQFGIPGIDRTRALLLEAERRYQPAADLASQVWQSAEQRHLYGWQAAVAADLARVALRAADQTLLATIRESLARPRAGGQADTGSVALAAAMVGADYAAVVNIADHVRGQAAESGNTMLKLAALEEAAVAAAVTERPEISRNLGREALILAAEIGADGITRRVTGRLRAVGIRFGQTAPRPRPSHGWNSLTQTESRIVELLAGGASGTDIARALFVTPRTVQAHISHALAKLDLTNRTELAAAAARRTST